MEEWLCRQNGRNLCYWGQNWGRSFCCCCLFLIDSADCFLNLKKSKNSSIPLRFFFQHVFVEHLPLYQLDVGGYSRTRTDKKFCPCGDDVLLIQTLCCQNSIISSFKIHEEWDGGSRADGGETGHQKGKDNWEKTCGWEVDKVLGPTLRSQCQAGDISHTPQ